MKLVVEQHLQWSVDELGRACRCSRETVLALVQEGVLRPLDPDAAEWRFESAALKRARRALHLLRELELDLPGAALAVELLERIDVLEQRLAQRDGPANPP